MWVIVHSWYCTCGDEECGIPETATYGPFETQDDAQMILEQLEFDTFLPGCTQTFGVNEILPYDEIGYEDEDEDEDDEEDDEMDDDDEDEEDGEVPESEEPASGKKRRRHHSKNQ